MTARMGFLHGVNLKIILTGIQTLIQSKKLSAMPKWWLKMDSVTEGLASLRKEFPPEVIGKLPKPSKAQTDKVKANFKAGIRCAVCGQWHHPDVVHLDYVGHAAITARLLDVDPMWNWEPLAFDGLGLPACDNNGLLWIRLTILGVTRIGCGDSGQKKGGDALKERIGDAIRNAAMRFGVALSLWHKEGELVAGESFIDNEGVTGIDSVLEAISAATTRDELVAATQIKTDLTETEKAKATAKYRERASELKAKQPQAPTAAIIAKLKQATTQTQYDEAMVMARDLPPEEMAKVQPIADSVLEELF